MTLSSYWLQATHQRRRNRVVGRHWYALFANIAVCRLDWSLENALNSDAIKHAFDREAETKESITCHRCHERWMQFFRMHE